MSAETPDTRTPIIPMRLEPMYVAAIDRLKANYRAAGLPKCSRADVVRRAVELLEEHVFGPGKIPKKKSKKA